MRTFDCVIFDCDGTLVDSESLSCSLLARELLPYGLTLDAADALERYRGWRLSDVVAHLIGQHELRLPDAFVSDFREIELASFDALLQPIAGVAQALSSIPLAKCVASSGPLAKIERALAVTRLAPFFGANVFSAHQVGSWKPDPGLFLFAARAMSVSPERCAVVEDSDVGVLAALSAGMTAFYFNPESRKPTYPDAVPFQRMAELPSLILGRAPSLH